MVDKEVQLTYNWGIRLVLVGRQLWHSGHLFLAVARRHVQHTSDAAPAATQCSCWLAGFSHSFLSVQHSEGRDGAAQPLFWRCTECHMILMVLLGSLCFQGFLKEKKNVPVFCVCEKLNTLWEFRVLESGPFGIGILGMICLCSAYSICSFSFFLLESVYGLAPNMEMTALSYSCQSQQQKGLHDHHRHSVSTAHESRN